ncbi:hypothetical protein ACHWQZ_G003886 [Mnemiopsis leidyi]
MFVIKRFTSAAPLLTRNSYNFNRDGKRIPNTFIGPFLRPIIAMGVATVGCFCMWYVSKQARAKETLNTAAESRFVLYQYSNCPFCSKVRAYLHSCGEDFQIVEVNPITKKETKAISDYKKVPLLVADGIQLKESSVITSVLDTHFNTGTPISEVVEWYPAVSTGIEDTNKGKEKLEYPNKYRIMGYDENLHEKMLHEAKWRKWIDNHFVHLISPNVYRTWAEAVTAFDYFTTNGNFSDFEKTYIRYVGAAAMYMIGKRLRKRHNLDRDVRSELYSGLNIWLRAMKGKKFHGGDKPNLADIEMYGMCSAFHGMPSWEDAVQNTKIEKWYNRMERYLKKKSAIGLTSANPTLTSVSTDNAAVSV